MVNPFKYLIPRRWRSKAVTIPVVRLQGMITTESSTPFKSGLSLGSCAESLEKAFKQKHSPAVALVINSPGGSPVQSRLIFRRIRDLAEENEKQVLVFVEDIAASGGYMIACAGDEIYADPSSVVGSIGVVSGGFGFTGLLKKIGVERRIYTAGKNKVSLDPFQPVKEADIRHLKALQLEIHEVFINLVKERRGEKLADNEDLFTGMFWTAIKGQKLGLVDGLGDIRSTLKARYGEKTELKLIVTSRGLLGRKPPGGIAAEALEALAHSAEERSIYARYGL